MLKKILIANRGEIAVRVINACQQIGVKSVAVYSQADKDAMHVLLADEAYELSGQSNNVYLDGKQIVGLAKSSGADSIHPGYGFLSENPEFASLCLQAGLTFIGPGPEVIRRMGSKVEARQLMSSAGIKVVPGSTMPVTDSQSVKDMAKTYGYPLAIKASAGGGGRGLKLVRKESEIEAALSAAQREGLSYFSNAEVYVEKYLDSPRHIEVQILADSYGTVVHLGERDCSSQRRHQKLLEESPALHLPKKLREELLASAVRGARALDYVSAGTFEGLVDQDDYYFLEVNTRVQVEHPVTELITGVDIVKEQILIASGERLSIQQSQIEFRGHAIECRINAENVYKNFLPNPGVLTRYREPKQPWVRVDSACYEGFELLPFYDSLLAKLIVWGKDRAEAIERAKAALRNFEIEGVATTIPFHLALLEQAEFIEGKIDTAFVEREMLKRLSQFMASPSAPSTRPSTMELAATQLQSRQEDLPHSRELPLAEGSEYREFEVQVNGKTIKLSLKECLKTNSASVNQVSVMPARSQQKNAVAAPRPANIGSGAEELIAPMPGLVKKINVRESELVIAGQVLVIFEAMKMETELACQIEGTVGAINVQVGDTVCSGQILMTVNKKED
jgi:acetyl-CoA carboxylase biotin carboxylase subunit